jgi:PPOX class F420-dependent enzyme/OxyR family protein/uncharacterized protein (TIGR02246 family)
MRSDIFDQQHAEYLRRQRHGMLATVASNGAPQNKPVGFSYDAHRGTIDIAGFEMERSAKFRNIASNPQVAFTVNDVPDPSAGAAGVRFMEVRGTAEQAQREDPVVAGTSRWIIRIHPRRLVSYNVAGSGMHTADLAGAVTQAAASRPAAGLTGAVAQRARAAVQAQISELQAGLGDGDAETYNRHFAADVMWGSPYGATVDGYDALHAIHQRMHASKDHAQSRYEIVRVLAVAPDVAVAHVRRDALDELGEPIPSHGGEPRFSEMALYVLVQRGGSWWLAAGHNTIINLDRGAVAHDTRR